MLGVALDCALCQPGTILFQPQKLRLISYWTHLMLKITIVTCTLHVHRKYGNMNNQNEFSESGAKHVLIVCAGTKAQE